MAEDQIDSYVSQGILLFHKMTASQTSVPVGAM